MAFLSEIQLFNCDIHPIAEYLESYEFHINSEDMHSVDLPLNDFRAKGGTMIMWNKSLSNCVKVVKTSSPSFASVIYSSPDILMHVRDKE